MQHLTGRVFSRLTVLAEFELRGRKRVERALTTHPSNPKKG